MSLIVQIQSIFISFIFGIFFSLLFNVMYKVLFTKNIFINVITNLLFVFSLFSLYYFLLYKINNGIIHIYFIITLIFSFFIYNRIFVQIRVKLLNKRPNSFN